MGLFTPDINRLDKNNRINELIKCLDHKNNGVRYSAFAALAAKPDLDENIKTRLKNIMYSDPDPWMRTIATLRYAELGDPSISDNLIQIIKEGSLKSKLALLRLIENNGPTSDVTVMSVITIGLSDSKILVRMQAITAANSARNPELIPNIGELLNEKHYKARVFAAKALYNIAKDESLGYLVKLLSDRNTEVHSAARTYISAIIGDYNRKMKNRVIITPSDNADPENPGVEQLIPKYIMEGLEYLYAGCNDRFRGVRIEALKSIAIFREKSSIDAVEKLLQDRFPEVRVEAINTLEKIGGKRAIEAIESLSHDKKRVVRDAVERALTRLNKI